VSLRITAIAASVLVAASCSVLAQQAQHPLRPAPLPKLNAPTTNEGAAPILTPTKPILTMFLTGLAAIKNCGFGGQDNLKLLGESYNLRPDSVDPKLAKPIMDDLESEIQKQIVILPACVGGLRIPWR
jgi:hypothetical protein